MENNSKKDPVFSSGNSFHLGFHLNSESGNQESFHLRLKKRREKLGLSQKELAGKTGVSVNTIQTYESNVLPKSGFLIAMADVLKCSIDWLLIGRGGGRSGQEE